MNLESGPRFADIWLPEFFNYEKLRNYLLSWLFYYLWLHDAVHKMTIHPSILSNNLEIVLYKVLDVKPLVLFIIKIMPKFNQ